MRSERHHNAGGAGSGRSALHTPHSALGGTPNSAHPTGEEAGLKVTIMGLGLFGGGVAAARYFAARGCRVTVTDLKTAEALAPSIRALEDVKPQTGGSIQPITYRLGRHDPADFTRADLVVVNPAVPRTSPYLAMAEEAGACLTSEMNLFFEHCLARLVGVTGTNGKSTTTTLLGDMLGRAMPTRVGGNIGRSLLEEADQIAPGETVVLELSSFQLADLGRIEKSPQTAVLLSLSPNHLDWHGTVRQYYDAKKNILAFQGEEDLAVLNADDPELCGWRSLVRGRAFFYSAAGRREAAVFADGPQVVFRVTGREERLDLASRLRLLGRHNLANVLAAATAARALGVGLDEIGDAVGALRPLPHRLEPIGKRESVLFVDDSKATTPVAARAAIEAFSQPAGPGRAKGTAGVILIAGGYDKKTDPAPMVAAARERAKAVLVIGQTGPALAAALDGGRARVERAGDLEAAVRRAVELAAPGDVVLLAPGHASWDMFDNYEQRGKAFRRAAEACGMQPLAP